MQCQIFNRWGEKIIVLKLGETWDGALANGKQASEGVYYYVVDAETLNGKYIKRTGFVNLFRDM